MIAHVNQYRLIDFLEEEFVLGVLRCRIGNVAEVLVTNEGRQENIVRLNIQCQFALVFRLQVR